VQQIIGVDMAKSETKATAIRSKRIQKQTPKKSGNLTQGNPKKD
jgi:hypothetical protein